MKKLILEFAMYVCLAVLFGGLALLVVESVIRNS